MGEGTSKTVGLGLLPVAGRARLFQSQSRQPKFQLRQDNRLAQVYTTSVRLFQQQGLNQRGSRTACLFRKKNSRRALDFYSANRPRFAAIYRRIIGSDRQSKNSLLPISVFISTAFLCASQ